MPFKTGFKCRFKCGDAAMAELYGHEKLIVYQKGMRFAVVRGALLAGLPKRVAACDHLARGAESILVNIAHASSGRHGLHHPPRNSGAWDRVH